MNTYSTVFIVLGLFLLGGVISFWQQKQSKSIIAVLAVGSAMAIAVGLLQL